MDTCIAFTVPLFHAYHSYFPFLPLLPGTPHGGLVRFSQHSCTLSKYLAIFPDFCRFLVYQRVHSAIALLFFPNTFRYSAPPCRKSHYRLHCQALFFFFVLLFFRAPFIFRQIGFFTHFYTNPLINLIRLRLLLLLFGILRQGRGVKDLSAIHFGFSRASPFSADAVAFEPPWHSFPPTVRTGPALLNVFGALQF